MKKIDSLNLVPFIDIMLVLLVIVLISASFSQNSQMQLDVPKVDSNQTTDIRKQSINISINKEGDIYVNDKIIAKAALQDYLSTLSKDMNIIIKSDKSANVQDFMSVFSILQNLQLNKVYMEVKND